MLEQLVAIGSFPGRKALIRARLAFDVAYMLIMREVHQAHVDMQSIAFGLIDSSPQGGRNWLLHEYRMFRGDMIDIAKDTVFELIGMPRQPPFLGNQWEIMEGLTDIINSDLLDTHLCVPTSLGSRHTSHTHKACNVIHSFRLESFNWRLTADVIKLFFTSTSDRGKEKHLRKVHVPSPYYVFPWWLDSVAHEDDLVF